MSLFISYSSVDTAAVGALERNLESFGKSVWRDDEILGGEVWWAAILEQIRGCEVFVFALSPNSLESDPCQYEYEYARALGLPILPVEIGDVPPAERRNHAIYREQLIDYRNPTAETAIQLVRAISELEGTRRPLPDPLPEAPPIPYEYLLRLSAVIRAKEPIPYAEQRDLIRQFREALDRERNESVRESAFSLLRALGDRPETSRSVTAEIEELIAKAATAPTSRDAAVTPPSAPVIVPTPTEPPVRREPNPTSPPTKAPAGTAARKPPVAAAPTAAGSRTGDASAAGATTAPHTPTTPHPTSPPASGSRTSPPPSGAPTSPPPSGSRSTPPGWFADPRGPAGQKRYWDGTHWTEHTHADAPTGPPPGTAASAHPASPPVRPATAQPAKKSDSNLWSVLGIVFGAITLIPIIGWVTWVAALAFAIVAGVRKERLWVVSLVVAILGCILGFVILMVIAYAAP
ncbi:TIR domain-containing protein [Microbacter sp. GSS18]|nr:TIR domain-containing protein [Microbacter sp. GSS18]